MEKHCTLCRSDNFEYDGTEYHFIFTFEFLHTPSGTNKSFSPRMLSFVKSFARFLSTLSLIRGRNV